jgi:hypothetical protein
MAAVSGSGSALWGTPAAAETTGGVLDTLDMTTFDPERSVV